MAVLDHWHPVYRSADLRRKPAAVAIDGRSIALFRDATGQVGALDDMCVHRRMKLSHGQVVDGRLRCSYHGWSFDACGQGESRSVPKMQACTTSYETREAHGMIWLRRRGSSTEFPELGLDGWYPLCRQHHAVPAPLEVTLDNFTEIEHTALVHTFFGFDLDGLKDADVHCESSDATVRVTTRGAQKLMPWWARIYIGTGKRAYFHDDWTTYFSPLYTVFDHYWSSTDTGAEALVRWKALLFFHPISERETSVWTLAYARSRWFWPTVGLWFFRPLMAYQFGVEVGRDMEILKGLASYEPSLEGMKLSRFDRALGPNRERINRIYRGEAPAQPVAAS
jgi:phenylpropionate dioxygenase-like ring-hydroxylating dioxygenase large terminal subunit